MEILKRARGDAGEMVAWNESSENVTEEVLHRNVKAGYCTRDGNPTHGTKIQGPGIGQSKLNQWPRDENGKLIGD